MIINYNVISQNSPNFNRFVSLYEQAFPADERRKTSDLVNVMASRKEFTVIEATAGNVFLGFFSFWVFSDCGFAYGEHFAIEPEARNGGIGAKFLNHIIDSVGLPLIIEVEPDETPIARRRVAFYERAGLAIWRDVDYVQPAYGQGKAPLPLKLMTTSGFTSDQQVCEAAKVIRKRVYGVDW